MKNKSKLVQQTIMARKNVRNLAITRLPSDKISVINMNTYNAPAMSRSKTIKLMHDFTEFKHKWSVLLVVFGRCPIDGEYWKTMDVSPPGKFYSSQINASLSEHHEKIVEGFNMRHFVSLGWIAKPTDGLFDNNKVYDLFERLGAFDYLAEWERKDEQ